MRLDLSAEEAAELEDVLGSYLGDLSHEIADTDRSSFRDQLRARKVLLQSVLDQLSADSSSHRP